MDALDHHHHQALSLPSSFYKDLQMQQERKPCREKSSSSSLGVVAEESRPARLFNSLGECRSTRVFHSTNLGSIRELENSRFSPNDGVGAAINSSRPLTGRQIATIFALIYGNFWVAACVSLQAPFYPKEAEAKGKKQTILKPL